MYDKARKGETVELSPRRISIFNFEVERSLDDRLSALQFCLFKSCASCLYICFGYEIIRTRLHEFLFLLFFAFTSQKYNFHIFFRMFG